MTTNDHIRENFSGVPFNWYFPSTDGGDDDGFNDSLRETFEGNHEHYVARESIQNSLDARVDLSLPVKVTFELQGLATAAIPDHESLVGIMEAARTFSAGQERAGDFYGRALALLQEQSVSVLKISDFNTTGLAGEDQDSRGGWYRLVRTSGSNSAHGAAGGSFGIGKGAPFAASELHTVFYGTISEDGGVAFQGKSRLSSFMDEAGDIRRGIGQLGLPAARGVRSVRETELIPEPFRRSQQGTDVFILGYKNAAPDWHRALMKSVLENFWAAIYFGDLEVCFVENDERVATVNKSNLRQTLDEDIAVAVRPYFQAVAEWDRHFSENIKELGQVSLYVKKGANFPRKIQMMRMAKMKVYERTGAALSDSFAAVFICENQVGNSLLRTLEPPAHDKWDPKRMPTRGDRIMRVLNAWIRDKLKSMSTVANTEPEDIPDLSRYLPQNERRDDQTGRTTGKDRTRDQRADESGSESEMANLDGGGQRLEPAKRELSPVKPPTPGGSSGGGAASSSGKKKKKSTGKPPKSGEGTTTTLLDPDRFVFRSREVTDNGRRRYQATIHPDATQTGALALIAVGDVGEHGLPVASAISDGGKEYSVKGSMIHNVELFEGVPLRLLITLESSRRYTLGVG